MTDDNSATDTFTDKERAFIDPKEDRGAELGEVIDTIDADDFECPLGDHPVASETTQNSPEDDATRETEGGWSQ